MFQPLNQSDGLSNEQKTLITAVASGTSSAIGGGKFANGAVSGAMIQIFNDNQDDEKHNSLEKQLSQYSKVEGEVNLKIGNVEINQKGGAQVMLGEGVEFGFSTNPDAHSYNLCLGFGYEAGVSSLGAGTCFGTSFSVYVGGSSYFTGWQASYQYDYIQAITDSAHQFYDSFNAYINNYMNMSNLGMGPQY